MIIFVTMIVWASGTNLLIPIISNPLASEHYKKPGLWEVNVSIVGHLIQTRFLRFFIPILPDLILPETLLYFDFSLPHFFIYTKGYSINRIEYQVYQTEKMGIFTKK